MLSSKVLVRLVTSLLATELVAVSTCLAAPTVNFTQPSLNTVGAGPVSVAVSDFNGDGNEDLAVANFTANTVSILLNNGNGTFKSQVSYATNSGPSTVASGDFNGDGKLDLAVYCIPPGFGGETGYISILIGNGDGTFQPRVDYTYGTSLGAGSLAVGDFNRDHKLDLAAANSGHATGLVAILLGNGDGTFQSFIDYSAKDGANGIAAGDFNEDHKLDLAIADEFDGSVLVLLGNGDGSFQSPIETVVAGFPTALVAADFNGDGKLDVAVNENWTVQEGGSILLGNGDGTFAGPPFAPYDANVSPVLGDFNNDGKLDLAAANGAVVTVDLGNGNGTFQTGITFTAGTSVNATAAGLLNRDNAKDLAVTDAGSNTVNVLLSTDGTVMSTESSLNPSHQGQPVTFTTSVIGGVSHQGVTGGFVTFAVDGSKVGTEPVLSGQAAITISDLSVGVHQVTATFSGYARLYRNAAPPVKQKVLPD
jgi:hypothetical protein